MRGITVGGMMRGIMVRGVTRGIMVRAVMRELGKVVIRAWMNKGRRDVDERDVDEDERGTMV